MTSPIKPASARLASTLILFQAQSYRLLMVKRARQLAFFPNAWVFPGGRVDDDDAQVATTPKLSGPYRRVRIGTAATVIN